MYLVLVERLAKESVNLLLLLPFIRISFKNKTFRVEIPLGVIDALFYGWCAEPRIERYWYEPLPKSLSCVLG